MKTHLLYIIAVAVCLTIGVTSHANEITMTTSKKGEVIISMRGSGTMNIDWGDGSAIETHTLSSDITKYVYSYSDTTAHTITITGNHITFLDCYNIQLTFLDVSNNTMLTTLWCHENQLTSLDVSNNTALIHLACYRNRLTSLNVSNNMALSMLECDNNQLSSAALNVLFGTLHRNTVIYPNSTPAKKYISINNNPGTSDCDQRIATKKGWTVNTTYN